MRSIICEGFFGKVYPFSANAFLMKLLFEIELIEMPSKHASCVTISSRVYLVVKNDVKVR